MLDDRLQEMEEFLREQPGMSIAPSRNQAITLNGKFSFSASPEGFSRIEDHYNIEIEIPHNFPSDIPIVRGLDDKVKDGGNNHLNEVLVLCLGSPLKLKMIISEDPTFQGFIENCLLPYLYGVSYKKLHGEFPFGELRHGPKGVIDEYQVLLGLSSPDQVLMAIKQLGMRDRVANKEPCPCKCGHRLGKCDFRNKLNKMRQFGSRAWFRSNATGLSISDKDYKKLKA